MPVIPCPLIGIFGGSFDPVHLGHVATAEELQRRLPFREIRFLPAARSPLKAAASADRHRLAMLELALHGKAGLVIDRRELDRAPPSYSIDTLRAIRAETGPGTALAFILGMDSFLELPRWKDWQQLTDPAHLLVVSRPGHHPDLPPALAAWLAPRRLDTAGGLGAAPAGGVLLLETAPWPVASRDIRAAIRTGRDTSRWLAPAVADYIEHHHLYAGDTDPQ
jgi:nicotinate-nucleotide adenylyltransferase